MSEKPERRSGLTGQSAVERLVSQATEAQQAEADKNAGRDGRGRAGNAGEKGRDSQGTTKATYALSIERQAIAREIAEEEDVSQTDIVEAALVLLANARKAGKIDLSRLKTPIKSLRFSWHLEVPDDFFFE
jgi:hypothetical protein